jgi:hypothetical protein
MDAVRIVDQTNASTPACLLHGSVLLASLERGRVYPLNGPDGSAITVFTRAQTLPPFDSLTSPGVARVTTAEDAAVFPYAPEKEHGSASEPSACNAREGWADAEQDRGRTPAGPAAEDHRPAQLPSTHAGCPSRCSCSEPGNARSSGWSETTTKARGNA